MTMNAPSDPHPDNTQDAEAARDNQQTTPDESQCAIRPENEDEEIVQLGLDSCGD